MQIDYSKLESSVKGSYMEITNDERDTSSRTPYGSSGVSDSQTRSSSFIYDGTVDNNGCIAKQEEDVESGSTI